MMKTVGETLRTAREKNNYDLHYISDTLKIREKYLEALEVGDYSLFPSPIYIKGFLKNYAKFLHLDENELLALYRREYTDPVAKDPYWERSRPVVKTIKFALKPSHLVTAFTIIFVLFIVGYLFYEFRLFSTPPALQISTPSENEIVNTNSITVIGTTDPANKVYINGAQVPYISTTGDFSLTVNLHDNINELTITSTNNLNRTTTIKRDVIFVNKALSVSQTTTPTPSSLSLSARLVISGDNTWIHVNADNKVIINGEVLTPGTIKTFSALQTIVIQTGRPSDTKFSVNGQTIDLSGDGTQVVVTKKISFDATGNLKIENIP